MGSTPSVGTIKIRSFSTSFARFGFFVVNRFLNIVRQKTMQHPLVGLRRRAGQSGSSSALPGKLFQNVHCA